MRGSSVGLYSGTPGEGFPTFPLLAGTCSGIIEGALEVYGPCLHHPVCSGSVRRGERGRAHPSINTVGHYVTGRPAHNWTGIVGAYFADAMLQLIGVAAFFLPLVLGRLGVCWMRSRPAGSPLAKTIGLGMWVVFAPAAIALLPGAMLWRQSLPVEGTSGRLLADFLVHYLNLPGAAIVLTLMVALSLYLT